MLFPFVTVENAYGSPNINNFDQFKQNFCHLEKGDLFPAVLLHFCFPNKTEKSLTVLCAVHSTASLSNQKFNLK